MPQTKNQHHEEKERSLWGIILAGGNGSGPRDLTRLLYSDERPKQFGAFIGTRSLVQHTIDRTSTIVEADKILTVVSGKHLPFVREQLKSSMERLIIVQPYSRDTAPEILLPLSKIHHQDPWSITAIFPSDHFILDEWKFMKHIRKAAAFVEKNPEKIVLLGVRPEREENGFGWIGKGNAVTDDDAYGLFQVCPFTEKPKHGNEGEYFENTLILVARTDMLMERIRHCIPDMYSSFAAYRIAAGKTDEWHAVNAVYDRIRPVNFSSSVLEKISSSLCVMDISDVGWNNWGEDYRIKEDAIRYDLRLNTAIPDIVEKTDEQYCLIDAKTEMKQ